ncbi:MAG: Hsp70 family protein [Deltaproteobacteria bacterium]|nr:Hsp70 family protein [Deltaproteobacteria bacterium]
MSNEYAVGIDLGTTNSVISIYRRGKAETIPIDGRNTLPSVVSFADARVIVGEEAKSRLHVFPENSVASVKRHMGNPAIQYKIHDKSYSPVDISSLILSRLVDGASENLNTRVINAVITVPAYFNESQKLDTRLAGEKVGLNVLRLIPEPTAAAVAYGLDKGKDQTILVYDLGGGTFDVSILRVEGNKFRVLAVDGDSQLGGDDFDEAIVKHFAQKFREQEGMDLIGTSSKEYRIALQKLKEEAENAKIELSSAQETEIIIPDILGRPFYLKLSREQFLNSIRSLIEKTFEKVDDALTISKISSEDIDRVILVGGSTRIPAVRDMVAEKIKEPYTSERVDEAVAHGAAIVAASFYLPEEDLSPVEVINVTAHSLGIEMMRPDYSGVFFQPLIKRNSTIPCKGGKLGSTVAPYQEEVRMRVYRGENDNPSENTFLTELVLPISKPTKGFIQVAAVFNLDEDGIIHFTAVEMVDNPKTRAYLENVSPDGLLTDFETLEDLTTNGHAKSVAVQFKGF